MLTRKTFEKFADAVACTENVQDAVSFARVCVTVFQESNKRFNKIRFLDRCGFSPKTIAMIDKETS